MVRLRCRPRTKRLPVVAGREPVADPYWGLAQSRKVGRAALRRRCGRRSCSPAAGRRSPRGPARNPARDCSGGTSHSRSRPHCRNGCRRNSSSRGVVLPALIVRSWKRSFEQLGPPATCTKSRHPLRRQGAMPAICRPADPARRRPVWLGSCETHAKDTCQRYVSGRSYPSLHGPACRADPRDAPTATTAGSAWGRR